MTRPDLDDPALGRFQFVDEYEWYEGRIGTGDAAVLLHLNPGDGPVEPVLERARKLAGHFEDRVLGAKDYALARLMELRNDEWLGDDERSVAPDEFEARMTLESVTIEADGTVTFWFDDGDLFSGHFIEVTMNARDEFTDADIAG